MKIRRHLFFDPNLGDNAANTGQLHLVLVTIRAVKAQQPLDWFFLNIVNQTAHRQQGGAYRHIQVTRHFGIPVNMAALVLIAAAAMAGDAAHATHSNASLRELHLDLRTGKAHWEETGIQGIEFPLWISAVVNPVYDPDRNVRYLLGVYTDITHSKLHEELHRKVFHAIHVEKQRLATQDQIADWIAKQGVDRTKFLEVYNAFGVAGKARRATQLQDAYQVDGVPSLGIAGKYFTSGSLAQTLARSLQVADHLIAQSRKA